MKAASRQQISHTSNPLITDCFIAFTLLLIQQGARGLLLECWDFRISGHDINQLTLVSTEQFTTKQCSECQLPHYKWMVNFNNCNKWKNCSYLLTPSGCQHLILWLWEWMKNFLNNINNLTFTIKTVFNRDAIIDNN